MAFTLSKRTGHRMVVVEFNPFQILAAEVNRPRRGNIVVESAAEFNREDIDGLRRWVESGENGRKSRVSVICGVVPHRCIVHRESVHPERLNEPGYLENLAEEQQKGWYLTATPLRILNAKTWTLRAVSAFDGSSLPRNGPACPALICAIANDEVLAAQQRLFDSRMIHDRIEPGLLSLFGAVYGDIERRKGGQAVVVVVIHQSATMVYILGREGVHTPNPILHGLDSIIEMGRKELGEVDEAEVLTQLQLGNPQLVKTGPKLVRRIGRDLKPVVDSFEMTTGQPVDEILCAYLPTNLSWLAEPLAEVTGRTPLVMDCEDWLPTAGLQVAEDGPTFGPHWVGALSLVSHLPEPTRVNGSATTADYDYNRPWHVDYSLPTDADDRKRAGREFIAGALACAVACLAIIVTAWQLYAMYSLRTDTGNGEKQMAENRKFFEELNSANAKLKSQTAVLDSAYALGGEPYPLSYLMLSLARTIPPRMRVDRIDANDIRVVLSGALLEPAEEAAGTLGRHMDDIRRNPELGPLFSRVAITSLQRRPNSDSVVFELTLQFKPAAP